MNKSQIWEILECCLLASDKADMLYLLEKGFNPELAKMGLQFCFYLQNKKIEVQR